jgi:hypothetical protein
VLWPELTDLIFGQNFDQDLSSVKCPKLQKLTLGEKFNKPDTIMFINLYYIYDYSNKITEYTYKIPKTLHEIIHKTYYSETTIYKRSVGQFTKTPSTF